MLARVLTEICILSVEAVLGFEVGQFAVAQIIPNFEAVIRALDYVGHS